MSDPLSKLLGQTFASKEAQAFIATLPGPPEVEKAPDSTIYDYPAGGVSVSVAPNTDRIFMIVFYGGGKSHAEYAGALPEGLRFSMTRPEVQKLLGPPEVNKGDEQAWGRATHRLGLRYGKDGRIRRATVWGS
jgi:hypothetical protein